MNWTIGKSFKKVLGFVLFCYCLSSMASAQDKVIVLSNCETSTPVDFAHVQNITTKSMSVTNEVGEVVLNVKNSNDSLF